MTTNYKQGLEPLVCNEPKILILGSLPGDISIESQEYYANHKNFFWRIIATITGSPVPLSYPAKKEMLAQSHIALWDVYAAAERTGSSDGNIRGGEFNDIVGFIRKNPTISTIVFNGKKAATSYTILEKASRHDKHSRTSAHLRMPKHKPGNPLHGTDF